MSLPDKSETNKLAKPLQDQAKQLSQGIYRLVHDLRPSQLDDLGLIPALQYLAHQERQRMNLEVLVGVDGERQRLDPIIETVIFPSRSGGFDQCGAARPGLPVQRCVLAYAPGEISMQIEDAGIGF